MTCTVGKISNVQIHKVTNDSIVFTTDSKLASATNASDASDKRIPGLYHCPKSDVLHMDQGMLDGIEVEQSVQLAEGAIGPLYLESRSLQAPGTSFGGPSHIRGFKAPLLLHDEVPIPLKWPECGGADDRDPLQLVPSSITVSGYTQDPAAPARQVSVNLFDLALALPAQEVDWQGAGDITLGLTPAGFQEFNLPPSGDSKVKIWPTRIVITGKPVADLGHGSAIDIRNHFFAWPVQRLTWQEPPPRVAVHATSAGFAKFGILPETLRSAVNLVLAASEATDGLLPAIEHIWRARRSTADWEFYTLDAFDHASDYRKLRHLQERWEFGRSPRGGAGRRR